jgi:hypothetical protein
MAFTRTPGRTIAASLLCAVAATVAVWSGPLASATSALHTSGTLPAPVALDKSNQPGQTER